ncbi:MAG: hypothetical protein ACI9K3_001678, partial [Halovenus sp.]
MGDSDERDSPADETGVVSSPGVASERSDESVRPAADGGPTGRPGQNTGSGAERPPAPAALASVFEVYEMREDDGTVLYVGEPRAPQKQVERSLWSLFRERGYDVSLRRGYQSGTDVPLSRGEHVLVAEPRSVGVDGVPWLNVGLFVATVLS